jgi:hypothetical protein
MTVGMGWNHVSRDDGGASGTYSVIVILDDNPERLRLMHQQLDRLAPTEPRVIFDNAPDLVAWLRDKLPTVRLLCLDHDLGPNRNRDDRVFDPGTGRDVVNCLIQYDSICPVVIHSSNGPAATGMQVALEMAVWRCERVVPAADLEWIPRTWTMMVKRALAET